MSTPVMTHAVGGYALTSDDLGLHLVRQAGQQIVPALVLYQLQRRRIAGVNLREISVGLRNGEARIRLGAADAPFASLDEDAYIVVTPDEMSASVILIPPDAGQNRLTVEALTDIVRRAGVQFGLMEDALRQLLLQPKYNQPVEVARALEPVHGTDGRLEFHFRKQTTGAAMKLEDGRIDYRSLDLFEGVTAGQKLITRILPIPGTDGKTVRGKAIKAREGRNFPMPPGRNVEVVDDGNTMIAVRSGRVDMVGNRVVITDVLTISDDVNMTVGNLNFDGSISILGNVITGMTVKATGSIEVRGIVEGAVLEAGADITLKQGIQGGDRGVLTAGGNIIARFIERSTVIAHGSLSADTILHSQVQCGRELVVTTSRGSIIGGNVCAGQQIAARTIGSNSGISTVLEVGVMPSQRKHLDELKLKKQETEQQLRKLEVVYGMLSNRSVDTLAPKQREQMQQVLKSRLQFVQTITEINNEILEITQLMENTGSGKVHVLDRAFPGTKIIIGTSATMTDSVIEFATFKRREGEVAFSACEYAT